MRKIWRYGKIAVILQRKILIFHNMENVQEILERVERMAKDPKTITAEDRAFLREVGPQLGVEIKNKRCKDCYTDAAILCALKCRELLTEPKEKETDGRRYVLKKGVDVYFGTIRVNEVTLTDELAERIIARGFERKLFEKCE